MSTIRQPVEETWLTPDEASQRLRVAPKTLANWRYTGDGPAFRKVGHKREGCVKDTRHVVYPLSELVRWATLSGLQYRTETA